MNMKRLILTGGGTAGHCVPHFALLRQLQKHFDDIVYIGSKDGIERELAERMGLSYYGVTSTKLIRGFSLDNLTIPFKLKKGVNECNRLLITLSPTLVFSKGGYVSLPVALAAHKQKIPLVIHESDYSPGLANKICAKYADSVLTSFDKTANCFKRGIFTGAPIRDELFTASRSEGMAKLGITSLKPILLVFGGSSGAAALNAAVRRNINALTERFYVLHITGKGNIARGYRTDGYKQIEYLYDMQYAYAVCDIALARCGSNSAFELIAGCIPTLFVPLPQARSRGDQILNAEYFRKKGFSRTLLQEEMTDNKLIKELNALYADRAVLTSNMRKSPETRGNAAICKILTEY